MLYKPRCLWYITTCSRGISAAGSAPHWQCGGQRFESAMLHIKREPSEDGSLLMWLYKPDLRMADNIHCRFWQCGGKPPMTVSDGNLIDTEVNRNERAPQYGAATIEVAEED